MSNQAWFEPFIVASVDGTALASSTTPTSLLPAGTKFILNSTYFDSINGKTLRVRASGRVSTLVTSPGTLTLDLRFGSTAVFSSGAMTLNVVAQTNMNWIYEAYIVIRSVGATTVATVLGQGEFRSHAVIGSPAPTAGGAGCHVLPYNTAPAAGTGFDSTAAQTVDFYGTWSVSNAANSIQLHQFELTSIN